MRLLACGPSPDLLFPFVVLGVVLLLGVKFCIYVWFVYAFRYRVASPLPMSHRRAWAIAMLRTVIGAVVVSGTWYAMYETEIGDEQALLSGWIIVTFERAAVWWLLGAKMARLQGRRLLGWTLSGVAIDATTDAAIYFTGEYGLAFPVLSYGAMIVFVGSHYIVGRRSGLLNQYRSHCLKCGYDLAGNVSGRCPECGQQMPGDSA
jgi:hypothetical protein